jgi:hypothetical protein
VTPLALTLTLLAAHGDPPDVRYATKIETRSWTPIELKDVEPMVESHALAELTKGGVMHASRSGFGELKDGDYSLILEGRFIEDAESFSVYITFGGGKRTDLPSFHVSETTAIGGKPRSEMQKRIEAIATSAGKRLAEVLAPELESVRLDTPAPPLDAPALPWSWGPIDVREVPSPSKLLKELLDVRNPDHVRAGALGQIKEQVFDQAAARDAVQLCLLRDPSPSIRASCARALVPVARNNVPVQRVILKALRSEVDENVVGEISTITGSFVGLSRKECLESWLEMVASDATPAAAARKIADLLYHEGDVPNLDLAVARCLLQEALAYGKREACADLLLRNIPEGRRRAVILPYLKTAEVHEAGGRLVFEDAVGALVGRDSKPIDPALGDVFLSIAARPSSGHARNLALYQLRRHSAPSPATIEPLIAIAATDPELSADALETLRELVARAPDLKGMTRAALGKIRPDVARFRRPSRQSPLETLDKTLEALGSGR